MIWIKGMDGWRTDVSHLKEDFGEAFGIDFSEAFNVDFRDSFSEAYQKVYVLHFSLPIHI